VRLLALYGGAFVALFLFFALTAQFLRMSNASSPVPIPDEQAVAQQLLEQKLSGPGYFKIDKATAELPNPYITPAMARAQVERIVTERHLNGVAREKLEAVIGTLTEPSPSRMVGTDRINTLKLNLALDEM
jgi:K+-transporting ATPase c subunit